MPKIQCRRCPFTGKLFEESKIDKYILHLKTTRDEMRYERNLKGVKAGFSEWLKVEKLKLIHPDMVPEWFIANQRHIMDAVNAGCRGKNDHHYDKFFADDVFQKVYLEKSPVFNLFTSNSHSCPDNGETNWCEQELFKPTGYPGWRGHIHGSLNRNKKHNSSYPYTSALKLVGIKTGGGGGGNERWAYDFTMFLADWPGFEVEYRKIEGDRIIAKLKGVR
jgi:hypothetical protein